MKRNDAEQIGEMIRKFFRQNALEAPLNEYRLIQAWKDVATLVESNFVYAIRRVNRTYSYF